MLTQKPVLAIAVSNMPELNNNGENGYLFPLPQDEETSVPGAIVAAAERENRPPSVEGLSSDAAEPGQKIVKQQGGAFPDNMAETLVQLAKDPGLIQTMGCTGRAFALAEFSQDTRMDRLEALLR